IKTIVSADDFNFFLTLYVLSDGKYVLQKPVANITANDLKRLNYIFVSSGAAWGSNIAYTGLAPSMIYFVDWDGNPWLPFSFSWNITYYPFADILPDQNSNTVYSPDFILNNFKLGDVSYEHKGPV